MISRYNLCSRGASSNCKYRSKPQKNTEWLEEYREHQSTTFAEKIVIRENYNFELNKNLPAAGATSDDEKNHSTTHIENGKLTVTNKREVRRILSKFKYLRDDRNDYLFI
jgi:hypothetical protein